MAVASVAAAIAVSPLPSSLFLRRPTALSYRPYLFFPPRASSAPRVSCLVVPFRFPSLHRPKSRRLVTAASGDSDDTDIELDVELGGGEGFDGPDHSAGGGGGGGDDESGTGGGNFDDGDEGEPDKGEKNKGETNGMSMSQKLTLGYAALVGVGGIMGYVKSGSQKSLAAGGIAALVLYFVYKQLPTSPAFASSIGLGLSAALLVVMGSRFKKSGKIFPAGIVSLASLVMVAQLKMIRKAAGSLRVSFHVSGLPWRIGGFACQPAESSSH
ncbi:protein FATTY ACID EXPORT 2, chloroplastic [Canna indica]|uniref:Protein FATTY ACID EXPORT 2, chloroplastic n=1 Tax=Canna indica TaxID=4628 RepID=A0AAQ3QEY1_9LILI|nr:protein FATTY ACID EXPORT 2, chloroplastic [Canna indica]